LTECKLGNDEIRRYARKVKHEWFDDATDFMAEVLFVVHCDLTA